MLKLIATILKLTAFAALVLILGSYFRWDGKTISDQVRTHLSHADPIKASKALRGELQDHWQEMKEKLSAGAHGAPAENHKNQLSRLSPAASDDEEIPPSERQKLRALIRELNSSRGKD